MSEIRVTSVVGENGGDRVGLTTGLTVGPLTGTTGIGATITHQGHAQFAGVCTASSFSGSGASLTSLPAANLTGALPAISGANLTGLSSGLSMVDMWHVTQQSTFQSETAAVNWGRSFGNMTDTGQIGSAMTNSGQYFTFPVTGIYEVEYQTLAYVSAAEARYIASYIYVTNNNSNYYKRGRGYSSVHSDSSQTTFSFGAKIILDVTNISTHKVYFANACETTATLEFADLTNDVIRTYALFKKLGDT